MKVGNYFKFFKYLLWRILIIFLKAAIKKVTEKLNEIVVEKIEEASNIAQDIPEKIKKEFDTLKEAIIEEAARMENEVSNSRNVDTSESNQDPHLSDVLKRNRRYQSKNWSL